MSRTNASMDAVEFIYDGMDEIMLAMINKASADKDPPIRGGSNRGRSPNLNREIHLGHKQIMNDYLSPNATYREYKSDDVSACHQDCFDAFVRI